MWRTLLVFYSTYHACRGRSYNYETQHPLRGSPCYLRCIMVNNYNLLMYVMSQFIAL